MSVSSQIIDGVAESIESLFDIRTPVFFIQRVYKFIPVIRVPQFFARSGKDKLSFLEKSVQKGKIFALKLIPQDIYRDKKVFTGDPEVMIRSQSAAGNDTVHMNMILQFLIPGMQDLNDTGCCTEILLIRS